MKKTFKNNKMINLKKKRLKYLLSLFSGVTGYKFTDFTHQNLQKMFCENIFIKKIVSQEHLQIIL